MSDKVTDAVRGAAPGGEIPKSAGISRSQDATGGRQSPAGPSRRPRKAARLPPKLAQTAQDGQTPASPPEDEHTIDCLA